MRRTRLLAFRVPIRLRANEDNIEQNKNQFPLWNIKLDMRIWNAALQIYPIIK